MSPVADLVGEQEVGEEDHESRQGRSAEVLALVNLKLREEVTEFIPGFSAMSWYMTML